MSCREDYELSALDHANALDCLLKLTCTCVQYIYRDLISSGNHGKPGKSLKKFHA